MSMRALFVSLIFATTLPLGAGCLTEPEPDDEVTTEASPLSVEIDPGATVPTCTDVSRIERKKLLCPIGPAGYCTRSCTDFYHWDYSTLPAQCVQGLTVCSQWTCTVCPEN